MVGVLVSTIYEKSDSTKLSIREFNIQKMFLLVDKKADETQLKSIDLIKQVFGNTISITEKKIEVYDIISVSKDVVTIIDSIPEDDKIFVDISQGRKTQALGLLFACYARKSRIEKIIYWGDDKKMTILPKFPLSLTEDDKKILNEIEDRQSITNLLNSPDMSRSKLYRLTKKLEEDELIKKEDGKYILTDAGKIAILYK